MTKETGDRVPGLTNEDLEWLIADCERLLALLPQVTPEPWEYDGMHNEIHAPKSNPYDLIVSECRSALDQERVQDECGHQYDANFDWIAQSRNNARRRLDVTLMLVQAFKEQRKKARLRRSKHAK